MPSRNGLAPLALLLAALVSGCAGSDAGPGPTSGGSVTVVTDPAQGRQDPSMGEHLHDYWGSADRKVVLDATVPVGYMALGGGDGRAAVLLPEPGDVVPQGTARVEVTMAWTPSAETGATNQAQGFRLAVRTAADREAQDAGPIDNGVPVTLVSANERNDLPHQVLSSWEFHWMLDPFELAAGLSYVSYQGELRVHVEAIRGLEIPLYPGHPDQWQGRTEFALFEAEGMAVMDGDAREGNVRCYGGCPPRLTPANGVVVPIDARHVRVVVERGAPSPTRLGLAYHTAVSRDWQVAMPVEETDVSRVYVIDVLDGGDGAYARQSNWEFVLFVEEPVEDGYLADTFRVAATVHKEP